MNRVPVRVRSLARIVTMCVVAALILASCASTTKAAVQRVTGLPSISISVPLSVVGCTTHNSCAALGTSSLDVGATSVGEYRAPNGRWSALTVPSTDPSTYIQAASCWTTGCLFVGQQSIGDLIWRYDAATHSISADGALPNALGVQAVSCFAPMSCSILDLAKDSTPRFLTTTDAGATWSTPVTFAVPAGDSVASLACTSSVSCIASLDNNMNGVAVYVTNNAGETWTLRSSSTTVAFGTLTSLNCTGKYCLALAKLASNWHIVHTKNFGRSWTKVTALSSSILTLSCSSLAHCVIGGTTGTSLPWLATVDAQVVTPLKLTYVPSPILDVSCGAKICAAIGVTTLLSLRP
jgi:hypothetical protein